VRNVLCSLNDAAGVVFWWYLLMMFADCI